MSTYKIDFSDPLRSSFYITPGGFNGPGGSLTASTLRLYGRGATEWGEAVNEDLVRLSENFAGATPPTTPISGQLWIRQRLYVYNTLVALPAPGPGLSAAATPGTFYRYKFATDAYGTPVTGGNAWYTDDGSDDEFEVTVFNGTISAYGNGSVVGEYVYSLTDGKLYRWDTAYQQADHAWLERSFMTIAADPNAPLLSPEQSLTAYNQFTNEWNTIQTTIISTDTPTDPIDGQMWYDPSVPALYVWTGSSWDTIFISGSPMAGDLDMGTFKIINLGDPTGPQDAVTLSYADTNYVNVSGDTMTGALVMPLGAVGAPSLTFTSDLNTGIYSTGADTIDFATNGVKRFTISNTAVTSTVALKSIAGVAPDDVVTMAQLTSLVSPAAGSSGFANIYTSLVATNVAGDIAVVAGVIYIATAPNTWKQVWPAQFS